MGSGFINKWYLDSMHDIFQTDAYQQAVCTKLSKLLQEDFDVHLFGLVTLKGLKQVCIR